MSIRDVVRGLRQARVEHRWLVPNLIEHMVDVRVVDPPGPEDWLSASSLPSLCPRMAVMAHRLKAKLVEERKPQDRWVLDRGTALHVMVQELWLGPMGSLLGGWRCPACAHVHGMDPTRNDGSVSMQSAVPLPKKCQADGCKFESHKWGRFTFVEPQMRHDLLKVRGQCDGIIHMPPHAYEVLDLKNTQPKTEEQREKLRDSPRHEHIVQLHWYMDQCASQRGRLLYMDPGAIKIEDAFYEHQVKFDGKLMEAEKEKVRALRQALADEATPIPECPTSRKTSWGAECACVEVEVLWARRRAGLGP